MNLATALRLNKSSSIAFVGAGGKTTAMFQLAREMSPCIVTTTTHLGGWQIPTDEHLQTKMIAFVWPQAETMPDIESVISSGITMVTGALDETTDRYQGLSLQQVNKLRELAGYHDLPLLIEADGSRQHPLKAPAEHEPVIPSFVNVVVVVAGLTGLGKPLSAEHVHRPELFSKLSGLGDGELITPEALTNVLTHPEGGLKNISAKARRVVLLNQADTLELQAQGAQIARLLLESFDAVIVASLQQQTIYAAHEKVAGIILAAGESKRYGQPKQLLDYHGKPFVRIVAEKALAAGLNPVVVVTGANAERVEAAIHDLPVKIVRNENWPEGQSTSIRAGIQNLTSPKSDGFGGSWDGVGGCIFLLIDQPQVTEEVMRALIERHAQTLDPVVAPYIFDKRANPVLLDRVTFDELMKLSGDVGGRGIFSKFSPRYVNWYDPRLLLDVDTPEDYERLISESSE
jgi:molybdenum cofactor cytidylyltransferase